jgi:hypothetical protein
MFIAAAAVASTAAHIYTHQRMRHSIVIKGPGVLLCSAAAGLRSLRSKNDSIITAGAAGVKLWASKADAEGYANEKSLPASDRPWLSAAGAASTTAAEAAAGILAASSTQPCMPSNMLLHDLTS